MTTIHSETSSLKFAENPFREIAETFSLTLKHFAESHDTPETKLSPDFNRYLNMESSGKLKTFTLRNIYREIEGYAVYFVDRDIKTVKSVRAIQDLLYITEKHRGKGIGRKFILCIEDYLKEHYGVNYIYQQSKVKADFSQTLISLGYELIDYGYGKRI